MRTVLINTVVSLFVIRGKQAVSSEGKQRMPRSFCEDIRDQRLFLLIKAWLARCHLIAVPTNRILNN
jgi:hypothetical protein